MSPSDREFRQQHHHGLGGHRAAAPTVDGESSRGDVLRRGHFFQPGLGDLAVFLVDDHPARAVAAVDVEHDEQVVVDAAGRALELGDVVGPDLVRPGRATSSGIVRRGWVAWRRRSETSPLARKRRYMVDCEAK